MNRTTNPATDPNVAQMALMLKMKPQVTPCVPYRLVINDMHIPDYAFCMEHAAPYTPNSHLRV